MERGEDDDEPLGPLLLVMELRTQVGVTQLAPSIPSFRLMAREKRDEAHGCQI